MLTLDNDQIQQRHLHLEEITQLGHAAYPHRFDRTHTISSIVINITATPANAMTKPKPARQRRTQGNWRRQNSPRRTHDADAADGQGGVC